MTVPEMFDNIKNIIEIEQRRLEADPEIIKYVSELSDTDYMAQMMILTDEAMNGKGILRKATAYVLRNVFRKIHEMNKFYEVVIHGNEK